MRKRRAASPGAESWAKRNVSLANREHRANEELRRPWKQFLKDFETDGSNECVSYLTSGTFGAPRSFKEFHGAAREKRKEADLLCWAGLHYFVPLGGGNSRLRGVSRILTGRQAL